MNIYDKIHIIYDLKAKTNYYKRIITHYKDMIENVVVYFKYLLLIELTIT